MENQIQIIEDAAPSEIAQHGASAAIVLKDIIIKGKLSVRINGAEHIKFEGWQTVAKFYGTTVGVEWTKPLLIEGKIYGYEARAIVYNKEGRIISSAESSCSRDENNWKNRFDFQIRSMAQTRACAKALRNVFSWVVGLAGYAGTPAEEMDNIEVRAQPIAKESFVKSYPGVKILPTNDLKCAGCNKAISDKVSKYSKDKFDKELCMDCQKVVQAEQAKKYGDPDYVEEVQIA